MVDVADLTPLCPGEAFLACTWSFGYPGVGGQIGETDQRYDLYWNWNTNGAQGTYDVESVAAHETGHSIGLGHATSSDS